VLTTEITDMLDNPGSAVVFTMGATTDLALTGQNMFVCITLSIPSDAPVPSVYYLNANGNLELAGVSGQRNGQSIEQGGTLLATRTDVPETGFTTYTIGLLLDHMSTFVLGKILEEDQAEDTSGSENQNSGFSTGGSDRCFISTVLSPKRIAQNFISFIFQDL
jgi:hypothetical protein